MYVVFECIGLPPALYLYLLGADPGKMHGKGSFRPEGVATDGALVVATRRAEESNVFDSCSDCCVGGSLGGAVVPA